MDISNHIYEAEYQITGADPKNALPHHDDSIEIIQSWSDGGFFIVKNNIFPIKPGTLFLINATNTHYSNPSDSNKYNRSKVIISSRLFNEIATLCGTKEYLNDQVLKNGGIALHYTPSGNTAKRIDSLFKKICASHQELDATFSQLHIISALVQILENISYGSTEIETEDDRHTINLLARYINEHLNNWDDVRMIDIANSLHISQSRASHLFKELTNKTLTQYTTDLRIAEAKKLLLTTQMKIMDISDTLKFQNPTIFCKYFKKYAGCTPRQYRESNGISIKNFD